MSLISIDEIKPTIITVAVAVFMTLEKNKNVCGYFVFVSLLGIWLKPKIHCCYDELASG